MEIQKEEPKRKFEGWTNSTTSGSEKKIKLDDVNNVREGMVELHCFGNQRLTFIFNLSLGGISMLSLILGAVLGSGV